MLTTLDVYLSIFAASIGILVVVLRVYDWRMSRRWRDLLGQPRDRMTAYDWVAAAAVVVLIVYACWVVGRVVP